MKKDHVDMELCRHCGRPILVITLGILRKVVVDADAQRVIADPEGEEYVRVDGTKVKAKPAKYEDNARVEYAYRMHAKRCRRMR